MRDPRCRLVSNTGTTNLLGHVGTQSASVLFILVQPLGTDVIIGFDYCAAHTEAIRPRLRSIEFIDKTTVPNIKGLQKIPNDLVHY